MEKGIPTTEELTSTDKRAAINQEFAQSQRSVCNPMLLDSRIKLSLPQVAKRSCQKDGDSLLAEVELSEA